MQAQRYGYTQMVNNAILTNSSYKLRFAQDLTLYLSEIGLDIDGFDDKAGKKHWLEDPIWQPVRKSIESIMGSTDYLEQYFATNVVFEPLVGELFRSGFIMQVAASQNDFITPTIVSAAEADYERNLANTVELFHILAGDATYGAQNITLFNTWLAKHADLALEAANHLQPIWSQPRVKVASFADALAACQEPHQRHRRRNRPDGSGLDRGLKLDRSQHRASPSIEHSPETKNVRSSCKYLQADEGDPVRGYDLAPMRGNDERQRRGPRHRRGDGSQRRCRRHFHAGDDPHRRRPASWSSRWRRSRRSLVVK